jgi:uncharacterized protein
LTCAWRREDGSALVLTLHVQPGAKRTAVDGTHGEGTQQRLKVRLAAPPVDGKANAELMRFMADAFGVPVRNVDLVRGESSRQKVVRIDAPTRRPDRGWETR